MSFDCQTGRTFIKRRALKGGVYKFPESVEATSKF
jgi:hypothetical protein